MLLKSALKSPCLLSPCPVSSGKQHACLAGPNPTSPARLSIARKSSVWHDGQVWVLCGEVHTCS